MAFLAPFVLHNIARSTKTGKQRAYLGVHKAA